MCCQNICTTTVVHVEVHVYLFHILFSILSLLCSSFIMVEIALYYRCDIGSLTMTGNERNPILTTDIALYASE